MASVYVWLFLVQLLVLFSSFTVVNCKGDTKPVTSYFTLCPRRDAKALSECIKKNIIDIKPQLIKGIPSLNIIPFDPMFLPKVVFNQGGSFVVDTILTNVTLRGIGGYLTNNISAKMDDSGLTLEMSMTYPEMKITGDYQMNGRILLLPIRGNGYFEINSTNLLINVHMFSKVVTREGKTYLDVEKVKSDIVLKGVSRSWFYNLFNGDKLLGDATNNFLNENYMDSHQATKHLPEGTIGEVLHDNVSKIFSKYSVDELFLK